MASKKTINATISIILNKLNQWAVFFVTYFIYLLTVYPTVQTEDSGELIAAAVTPDIAHPPGYPLYVVVGKIFSTLIPFGNIAWKMNIMSVFFGAATTQLLYTIIKQRTKNDLIAFGSSLFYAFTNIIWAQSNRAEVYTLNTFCIGLIVYLLMKWHEDKKDKWLFLSALTFGLGVGNHHLLLLSAPAFGLYALIKNWKIIINPKIVIGSLLLLTTGLSIYAYLPVRTYIAPYDNPAFIEHGGLYTWDKFINFVNRKIYGGTVNMYGESPEEKSTYEYLPAWVISIRDMLADYGGRFINNNSKGIIPLLKIISQEYFFIPLFFFLPGLYYLLKKDWRWAIMITLSFLCYTALLLVFTPIDSGTSGYVAFSTEPFMMPALMFLAIIMSEGLTWLYTNINSKKAALIFGIFCLIPAGIALQRNFLINNESKNYLAYDFNKMALDSIPQNGYLISVGKDNMTFPLYYLRKVEKYRPDIQLEIYYSTAQVDEGFLQSRVEKNGGKPVFIDLLPPNYASMNIKPYGFVYEYGQDKNQPEIYPEPKLTNINARGIRTSMDLPNDRLKILYYIKKGIAETDPTLKQAAFNAVITTENINNYYLNIVGDYAYTTKDFDTAKKAYEKSGNSWGLQNIEHPEQFSNDIQAGMS